MLQLAITRFACLPVCLSACVSLAHLELTCSANRATPLLQQQRMTKKREVKIRAIISTRQDRLQHACKPTSLSSSVNLFFLLLPFYPVFLENLFGSAVVAAAASSSAIACGRGFCSAARPQPSFVGKQINDRQLGEHT